MKTFKQHIVEKLKIGKYDMLTPIELADRIYDSYEVTHISEVTDNGDIYIDYLYFYRYVYVFWLNLYQSIFVFCLCSFISKCSIFINVPDSDQSEISGICLRIPICL